MVVSHQRLSGTGYCFSASLPAYATCAALEALKQLEAQPERLARLAANSAAMHAALVKHVAGCSPLVEVHADAPSPNPTQSPRPNPRPRPHPQPQPHPNRHQVHADKASPVAHVALAHSSLTAEAAARTLTLT